MVVKSCTVFFYNFIFTLYLRFWSHIVVAYAFTFWTCYTLMKEYGKVTAMRLQFLATEKRRPDQFTVIFCSPFLVRRSAIFPLFFWQFEMKRQILILCLLC